MPTAPRALWITFAGFFLMATGLAGVWDAGTPTGLNGRAFAQAMERRETARAALDKVRKEAARWHADGKLILVQARVDSKGFSNNNGPAVSGDLPGGPRFIVVYADGWNYAFIPLRPKSFFSFASILEVSPRRRCNPPRKASQGMREVSPFPRISSIATRPWQQPGRTDSL